VLEEIRVVLVLQEVCERARLPHLARLVVRNVGTCTREVIAALIKNTDDSGLLCSRTETADLVRLLVQNVGTCTRDPEERRKGKGNSTVLYCCVTY